MKEKNIGGVRGVGGALTFTIFDHNRLNVLKTEF